MLIGPYFFRTYIIQPYKILELNNELSNAIRAPCFRMCHESAPVAKGCEDGVAAEFLEVHGTGLVFIHAELRASSVLGGCGRVRPHGPTVAKK